jgi:hypothetical protein
MSTTYEIVIRGRASSRLLRPLLDEFTVDHDRQDVTRLVGDITDSSHLHGVLAHLTSVCIEVISVRQVGEDHIPRPHDTHGAHA